MNIYVQLEKNANKRSSSPLILVGSCQELGPGAAIALSQNHYRVAGAPESRVRGGLRQSARGPAPLPARSPHRGKSGCFPTRTPQRSARGPATPLPARGGLGLHQAFTVNRSQAPSLTRRRGNRGAVLGGAPGPSLDRRCPCCTARGPRQTGRLERGSPAPTAPIWDSEHGRGTCRATHPLGNYRGLGRPAVQGGSGQLQPWGPCMSRGGAGCWARMTH